MLVQDPHSITNPNINMPAIDHEVAGRGISGVVLIPSAHGKKLPIYSEADFVKLAEAGTLWWLLISDVILVLYMSIELLECSQMYH